MTPFRSRTLRTAAALVAIASAPAHAGTLDLSFDIDPDLAAAAGVDPSDAEDAVRAQAEDTLKLRALKEYLNQMANANSLATQGMGADYATNPQRFAVGASIGTAACGSGLDFVDLGSTLPETGFAAEASAMAALNLGAFSKNESFLRRLVLSVNGMYFSGSNQAFHWEIYNWGAHLQLKLIRPKKHAGLVEWGGLDVTGGYEEAFYQLDLVDGYPIDTGDLRWDASGALTISSAVPTIPLEVSTNLRVSVLTVFGGAALDTRPWGSADANMSLTGSLSTDVGGEEREIGTVTATAVESSPANTTAPRAFLGAQVNIAMVKVYAQANVGLERVTTKSPTGDSYGGQVGLRIAM